MQLSKSHGLAPAHMDCHKTYYPLDSSKPVLSTLDLLTSNIRRRSYDGVIDISEMCDPVNNPVPVALCWCIRVTGSGG